MTISSHLNGENVQQPDAIPQIDLTQDDEAVAAELRSALTTIGFASLTNHGMEAMIPKAFSASKAFFSLPLEDKMKVAYQGHESNRGYIACGSEKYESGNEADRKETYDLNPDETDYQQPWPSSEVAGDSLKSFQEVLTDYFNQMDQLHLRIMRLIAVGLNISPEFLLERCNEKHENLRLLHYPETPLPKKDIGEREPIVRGNVHTDFGTITLLTQDGLGGLRVKRLDGAWIYVPPVENAVVVNVGDMLQRWTNDVLKANPHQVVEPRDLSNKDSTTIPERYSIAFFCNANKETMLECFEQCVSEDKPAKYPPVKAFDYITMRLSQTINAAENN